MYFQMWGVFCGSPENDIPKKILCPRQKFWKNTYAPAKNSETLCPCQKFQWVFGIFGGGTCIFFGISGGGRVFFWMSFSELPAKGLISIFMAQCTPSTMTYWGVKKLKNCRRNLNFCMWSWITDRITFQSKKKLRHPPYPPHYEILGGEKIENLS